MQIQPIIFSLCIGVCSYSVSSILFKYARPLVKFIASLVPILIFISLMGRAFGVLIAFAYCILLNWFGAFFDLLIRSEKISIKELEKSYVVMFCSFFLGIVSLLPLIIISVKISQFNNFLSCHLNNDMFFVFEIAFAPNIIAFLVWLYKQLVNKWVSRNISSN